MNIAIFPSAFYPSLGGVEELVRQLAHQLVRDGHRVMIATNRWPKTLPKREDVDGLDVRRAGAVNDVSVRRETDRIVLDAQAETDIASERAAAMLKADLFERVFGVRIAIEAQPAEVRL